MFTQGVYYRFGRAVFILSMLRLIMPIIFGIVVAILVSLIPRAIFYGASVDNIALTPGQVSALVSAGYAIPVYAAIVLICYAIFLILIAVYDYCAHKFMMDEYSLHVRDGILSRRETAIPFRQIQDVDLKETYTHRIFGVAEFHILTAGHEDMEDGERGERSSGVFRLIDRRYAVELQRELLGKAGVPFEVNEAAPDAASISK